MPGKFDVGDLVRPIRAIDAYPWLRPGRPLQIIGFIPCKHGYHRWYRTASRRGRPSPLLRSDELRPLTQRHRARQTRHSASRD